MTQTAVARALIGELAAELMADQDALAAALVERVHENPAVPGDRALREATREAGTQMSRQLLAHLGEGASLAGVEPPRVAIEYAHEFAHRGIELSVLLAVVRTGYAEFSRQWSSRLTREAESSPAAVEALSASLLELFSYIDAVSAAFTIAYTEERERWSRSVEAVRLDVVRSIIDGAEVDSEVAGQRLGYRLDARQRAFVVWSDDADPALGIRRSLDSAVAQLTARAGERGGLVVPLGGQVLAGWLAGAAADVPDARLTGEPLQLSDGFDIRAAVGSPGDGIAGFRASHRQALHARRVAQRLALGGGRVTGYASVSLAALATADVEHAREFVATELGALAASDEPTRRIAATVRVYLEEGRSRARTSRRLGLHTNTIAYRLARGAELLGHDLGHRPTEVLVALMLAPLLSAGADSPSGT